MSSATEQRRHKVLCAIVADYISSQEPVGSKALVDRHNLGVSSATIRNDMAVLESEGYIVQQHASSGRIPTEKGYQAFVDSIHDVKPLSKAERRAILAFLDQGVDLEDVLRRSVQLLSQLTRQAAVVQLPTLKVSRVRHCEVVELTPTRLLLVLITDTGRVDQRNVELGEQLAPEKVARLKDNLNRRLSGKTLAEASVAMADMAVDAPPDLRNASIRCATVLVETLVEAPSERLILSGASHLFPSGLPSVVEALEEQVVVLKLLSSAQNVGQVQVSIGDEELRGAAVVAAGYGATGATLGGMGVVGPNYMDYSGTMSKVSAVAQYVGRVLAGQ
ncbi:heat-inducible transcriptional repressor HrcA [Corynebacterium canis]|uniref:Heat-inducible transcription repressor HrcA n=1 Tax=Corynebacterium canis TaxID=679663 RepID=A0A5C5URB5_9CORY|nr:heat-inducible transcriptional repressor HrcA [Corynebacterium canis]TWT28528.1 heat-inducible transcriptional repressor HrcA [Corynebacterium canis]WJY75883.1 Heat-inducible transcription repressor HrcA [Corynebacterium canis]